MKYKSKVFENLKEFINEVEKQLGKSIKTLRYDRGGEYLSQEFLDYLVEHGIQSQWTPPYTLQHNGKKPNLVRHGEVNDGQCISSQVLLGLCVTPKKYPRIL